MNSLRIFSYCFLIASSLGWANNFPRGCEEIGFGFQSPVITFNDSGSQTFFLVHNNSPELVALERLNTEESFMTPKLQAQIDANQWAALASDISNMHFKCLRHTADGDVLIQCKSVLSVCQYPRVKFALSNRGSYWVSTNKSLQQVVHEATQKGIYLKW
jgi:hypothetical protein